MSLSIFQFNSFIFLILRNYFLKAFRIQYFSTYINLYVFYFKEDRFSFLYKYLKLKKIILNSLFYRKKYAFLLKKKGASKIRVAKGLLKILMLINKLFLLRFFHLLLKKPVFVFYLDAGYYPILRLKQNMINKVAFKKVKKKLTTHCKKKKSLLYKYKIKLINSLLKYKLLGL